MTSEARLADNPHLTQDRQLTQVRQITQNRQLTASRRDVLTVFVLGALLFLPGIGNHDLWNPDEARYAEVAREMLLADDWLTPRLNGTLYTQKPPLHFWGIMLPSAAYGAVTEVTARFSTLVAAAASGVVVLLLGTTVFGATTGRLASALFLTSGGILWQGRTAQMDMTLTFFVLLSMLGFARFWVKGRDSGSVLFFVSAGLGTMAKGLPALLPPLLGVVLFLALTRQYDALRRFRIGRGLLIFVGVVLLWLGPATWRIGWDYPRALILDQSLGRYVAPSGHHRPWFYYALPLFLQSLPFTPLLPAAWTALRRRGDLLRALWLVTWIAATVLFFSVSSGKRTVYIVALTAPMALLIARGLTLLDLDEKRERRLVLGGLATNAALFGGAALMVLLGRVADLELERMGPDFVLALRATTLVPAVGGGLALALAWRRRHLAAAWCLSTSMAACFILLALLLLPALDAVKSARELALTVARVVPPGEELAIYPMPDAGFLFYSGRSFEALYGPSHLRDFLGGDERRWLVIERDDIEDAEGIELFEVARDGDWQEGHLLLSTRPPDP